MKVGSPKYRKRLNSSQIRVLKICFKFRFVSVDLLARYVDKDRSTIYEKLSVLVKQGYLTQRYDSSYKLRGKPASYHLASKGIRYLRENSELSDTALRNMYKSKHVTQEHVDHCLMVMQVCLALKDQTKETFNIWSRYELAIFDFFIRPLPDLYLNSKQTKSGKHREYLLDIFDDHLPFWVIKKRLRAYVEHAEEVDLEDFDDQYPDILLIAPNERIEKRLLRQIENITEDFELYTTTSERLLSSEETSGAIWKEVFEEEYRRL